MTGHQEQEWAALGWRQLALGDRAGAEAAARRALEASDRDHDALLLLATLAEEDQQSNVALSVIERAFAFGFDDVDLHRLAGRALQSLGRPEDALRHYRRFPDDPGCGVLAGIAARQLSLLAGSVYLAAQEAQNRQRLDELWQRRPWAEAPLAPYDLVIGTATGYRAPAIAPFVRSCANLAPTTRTALLNADLDDGACRLIEAAGILSVPFDSHHFLACNLNAARMIKIYEFLAGLWRQGQLPRRVFLTDVRDLVFQDDPFLRAPDAAVCFLMEDPSITLGTDLNNAAWIKAALGTDKVPDGLTREPVSCSGTVLGSGSGMLDYALRMLIGLLDAPINARYVNGIDQGVHNLILQRGELPDLVLSPNGDIVATLGVVPLSRIRLDADGAVLDRDGRPVPVVHQYDRHPALTARVLARLGLD